MKNGNYDSFDPNGVGLKNGNFIGLPFTEEEAKMILLPIPWDLTTSYAEGTALAPDAILNASTQLDLVDPYIENAWKLGIYMKDISIDLLDKCRQLRPLAKKHIDYLENGGDQMKNEEMHRILERINQASNELNEWVYSQTSNYIQQGKTVGLIGGDHSCPLGYFRALSGVYESFGILHIDAHMDLRKSYEGFTWSHASIMYNALEFQSVTKLVQVGIRDYCQEELDRANNMKDRVVLFSDHQLQNNSFEGMHWSEQSLDIVNALPEKVYISFDVDGLNPKLCPGTGTPVPGGLEFNEAIYLLTAIVESGRKIIGFDVCESGNSEWDANVTSRIIYRLCNLSGRSLGKI